MARCAGAFLKPYSCIFQFLAPVGEEAEMWVIISETFVCIGCILPGWKNRDAHISEEQSERNDNRRSGQRRVLVRLQIRKKKRAARFQRAKIK